MSTSGTVLFETLYTMSQKEPSPKRHFLALAACVTVLTAQCVFADPVVVTAGSGTSGAGASGTETVQAAEGNGAGAEDSLAYRLQEARAQIAGMQVGRYGMTPVYPRDVEDGTYPVEVTSTSPFFRIPEAELTVNGDEMTARITIRSLSYQYVYPGTAEQAEQASEDEWIGYEEVDGCTVFTIPVEALDHAIPCAAFSKKKQIWYDRLLVFDAASLPEEALHFELPDYELIEKALEAYEADGEVPDSGTGGAGAALSHPAPEGIEMPRSDGEYSIEVNMTGGSGRASISSPTLLIVRDGRAYARLIWSSTYYDYMIVGGETYHNLTTDGGNSVFEIPITALDKPMQVIADTTAMGDPLEIEYTLTFYSDSVGDKGKIPQEAAKKVLVIALVILIGGGILNHFLKKKRYS